MEKQFNKLYNLSNNFSLITGACGLLGEQHAIALSEINSNLILIDLNKSKGKNLADKLKKKFKNKVLYFNCDITDKLQINLLKENLKKKKIKISVLINNAAINPQPDHNNKTDDWEKSIEVSLTGSKNMVDAFSEDMIKMKFGNIINIGSDLSIIAPDQSIYPKKGKKPLSYSIIKHGIVGMTKYYASLYASYGIRCNCLCPGGVYNKQNKKFIINLKKKIPMKRMAKKNEYIGALQFLASNASKYMTGQNLIIDGGRSMI